MLCIDDIDSHGPPRDHNTVLMLKYIIYTNKTKRNLFACVFVRNGRPCPVWNGSCFGHTGVTFDDKNDRPGPGSLRGHFEESEGFVLRL